MILISCLIAIFTLGLPALLWGSADSLGRLAIILGVLVGNFFLFRYISNALGSKLILTADGIQLSVWKRPLHFDEVKEMSALNNNGMIQLTIGLKEKIDPKELFLRPIFPFRRSVVSINVSSYKIKGPLLLEEIYRYFQREAKL